MHLRAYENISRKPFSFLVYFWSRQRQVFFSAGIHPHISAQPHTSRRVTPAASVRCAARCSVLGISESQCDLSTERFFPYCNAPIIVSVMAVAVAVKQRYLLLYFMQVSV
jgi:hypothetical protein